LQECNSGGYNPPEFAALKAAIPEIIFPRKTVLLSVRQQMSTARFALMQCGGGDFASDSRNATATCQPERHILMALERTFSIVKPDATKRNITGKVIDRLETAGLRVIASKRLQLTKEKAEGFYAVHKERPFFNDLVAFMTSGPVIVQVLEGENAIAKNREVMGATNPAEAAPGTIRADFAESIEANSVHGSDAPETAAEEIKYFFTDDEIVG
jgi:nucleoside-diphosphate kinase